MTTSDLRPDLRPALLHAFDVADRLVAAVELDDLDHPTPCAEFDLRSLLGHLITVVNRVRIVTGGGHFSEVEHVTVVADDAVLATWRRGLADLRAALPAVDLERPVTAPFGTLPAGAVMGSYIGEVAVHSWDLAVTIGRTDLLDADLAAQVLPLAMERIPAQGREQIPFGDVVPVPDDAPVYERLVGWFGRDPRWSAS